jgi:hypothetical protein
MKLISPQLHALLDFVSWFVFLLAPSHFEVGAPGSATLGCYLTAIAGFLVCMVTRYPLGVVPLISFRTHGRLELAYVPLLLIWPWLAGFAHLEVARGFFIATGIALLLLWMATDYEAPQR